VSKFEGQNLNLVVVHSGFICVSNNAFCEKKIKGEHSFQQHVAERASKQSKLALMNNQFNGPEYLTW
jgi:hypothetical protein